MHNSFFREEIEEFYCYLQNILRAGQLAVPSNNYDLVLDIMPVGRTQKEWSYYYACHETRCLFWLHTYDVTHLTSRLYGVKSPAHISMSHLSPSIRIVVSPNLIRRASAGILVLVRQLSSAGFLL
jgi:hypothetical protein